MLCYNGEAEREMRGFYVGMDIWTREERRGEGGVRAMVTGLVVGAGVEVHVGQGPRSGTHTWTRGLMGKCIIYLELSKMQIQQLLPRAATGYVRAYVRTLTTVPIWPRTYGSTRSSNGCGKEP